MSELLLVEDAQRVAQFVRQGLEVEGNTVTVAVTGTEGLTLATERAFDLIILDIMLPGQSGREVCTALRSQGNKTPILMLTAVDEVREKVGCLRDGADDYLVKPFDFDELVARVEALVRRGQGRAEAQEPTLELAGITLDRAGKAVQVAGQTIDLTPREFRLLEVLMDAPNRVLSRVRLLNSVWGYDSDPMTNVIDVYITRIRAKLGFAPEAGPIRTVRGYGYRFNAEDKSLSNRTPMQH